jgi:hypothetical protein
MEEEKLSYSIPTAHIHVINGQILRKEKEISTTPQDELSECVCVKDTKISDVGTVVCHRNIGKKRLLIKLCF